LGVKWAVGEGEQISGLTHRENEEKISRTDDEESNRLLYVALTRAEEHLILTWCQRADKSPSNWAKKVNAAFALNEFDWIEEPHIRSYAVPAGDEFEARILRTAVPPGVPDWSGAAATYRDVQVIEPPPVSGQFEANVTTTALSLFASCPRKYYLSGYLGWEGDLIRPRSLENIRADSHDAATIGTEVHALLAGLQPPAPQLESVRLAQVFERSTLSKRAQRAARCEREWGFVFAAGDLIVRGTIDLWFEDAQGVTLVDYKTNDIPAEKAPQRARDYTLQLEVYALALERALGERPKQAWLYFLRPDVALSISPDQAAESVTRTVRQFIESQENLTFPLDVGPHCRSCEFFRSICPARLNNAEM
jgi:ATP-dependent exoDNAse (exonuclease V) beta subunit